MQLFNWYNKRTNANIPLSIGPMFDPITPFPRNTQSISPRENRMSAQCQTTARASIRAGLMPHSSDDNNNNNTLAHGDLEPRASLHMCAPAQPALQCTILSTAQIWGKLSQSHCHNYPIYWRSIRNQCFGRDTATQIEHFLRAHVGKKRAAASADWRSLRNQKPKSNRFLWPTLLGSIAICGGKGRQSAVSRWYHRFVRA